MPPERVESEIVVFELSTLGDKLPSYTKTIGYKASEVFGQYFIGGLLSYRKG